MGPIPPVIDKVAVVVAGDETYGTSRFLSGILAEFCGRGIGCAVLALTPGPMADRCAAAGASVEYFDSPRPIANYGSGGGLALIASVARIGLQSLSRARRVAAWLRSVRPDVVLVRTPNLVPAVALAGRATGVPSFWIMPNDVSSRYPLDLNKRAYDLAFHLCRMQPIANSAWTRSTLRNRLVDAAVLHLGVDSRSFSTPAGEEGRAASLRTALGIPADAFLAGVFARLTDDKGQVELTEALRLLGDPRLHLLIVGGPLEGDYGKLLQATVERTGTSARVHLVGEVENVSPYYAACDFSVNSRVMPEPFGLSVVESMMQGKPVLAHAAGGPSETIKDGVTGWLMHDASPEAFRDGLLRVLKDRPSWPEMGRAARQHALAEFDIPVVADRLIRLLQGASSDGMPLQAAERPGAPATTDDRRSGR